MLIEVYLLYCHNRPWTVSFGYAILHWERIHPEYGSFYKLYQHAVWYLPEWKSIPDLADPFFIIPDVSFNVAKVFIIRGSIQMYVHIRQLSPQRFKFPVTIDLCDLEAIELVYTP